MIQSTPSIKGYKDQAAERIKESPILPKVEQKKSIKNDSTIIELLDRNLMSKKEIERPLLPKNLLDKTRILKK